MQKHAIFSNKAIALTLTNVTEFEKGQGVVTRILAMKTSQNSDENAYHP
jgi:hypothetical protein